MPRMPPELGILAERITRKTNIEASPLARPASSYNRVLPCCRQKHKGSRKPKRPLGEQRNTNEGLVPLTRRLPRRKRWLQEVRAGEQSFQWATQRPKPHDEKNIKDVVLGYIQTPRMG